MKHSNVWYIDERAEQLAIVYLTRHPELVILPPSLDALDLDYLVRIQTLPPQQSRVFGVKVTGVLDGSVMQLVSGEVEFPQSTSRLNPLALPDNMPICELLFIMETDEGFYRWLKEPGQDAQGQAILFLPRTTSFQVLDRASLVKIVDQINVWYDARGTRPRHTIES